VTKTISVVTPCYNEEENVRDCYEAIKALFDNELKGYNREHIFADNCSTDRTFEILREISRIDTSVKVIANRRNFGPLKNTYNGVMASTGDAVVLFMPADMQDPPELIPQFVKLWEADYEIVYGIRKTRVEGRIMRSIRACYYRVLSRLSEVETPPGVGDFQLVDRRVIEAMREVRDSYPFMRVMTFECGGRKVGIPYTWRSRKKGKTKNALTALVDQALNGLVSFTTAPLRLGLLVGFIISLLSIVFALVNFILGLIYYRQMTQPGIMTLIIAMFFLGGVQLLFMGIIGEYILAIYGQVRQKPIVFERERINFDAGQEAAEEVVSAKSPPLT
jgi:polyisoprenyl-phosphate glycosyltransferase